jgi:uncharacterized membrane protein YgdD (TMEM256/DUF423 family)
VTRWIAVAALLGAAGVGLGAFGAHGLRARVDPEALSAWQTAVWYHQLHAVALLAVALFGRATGRSLRAPAWLFTAGILLFSGSLYALVLTGLGALGPLTPLGGLCLIAGWLALLAAVRS